MRGALFSELQRRLLRVDERPVVTRLWTFSQCVQTLLFVQVFNLGQIFQVTNLKPRQDQQARLSKVRGFFAHPGTAGGLRVACPCLQLTTYCTSLVSQQKREGARSCSGSPGEGGCSDEGRATGDRATPALHS